MAKKLRFCAIDFEGDVGNLGLVGMSWYTDGDSGYVTKHDDMRSTIKRLSADRYTFVCHNAEYDITVGFWQLGFSVTIVYNNESFNHGKFYNKRERVHTQIWCSVKLSNGLPLNKLGAALGIKKYPTPQRLLGIDANKYQWKCDTHDTWECETCYAVRDAEIVYRYMAAFQTMLEVRGSKPKRTLGSNAIALWRAIESPPLVQLPSLEHDMFARQAYYGGRVECFKMGTIMPCYTADVQSMYPSVMVTTPMPNPKSLNMRDFDGISLDVLRYEGITECTIEIPNMYIPPLPYKTNDRLYFPIGTMRGTWCNIELRNAIAHGCKIITIHKSMWSTENVYPFNSYVDYLRDARQAYKDDKDPREVVCKIMLNALYGRLGLNPSQSEEHVRMLIKGESLKDFVCCDMEIIDGRVIVRYIPHHRIAGVDKLLSNNQPIPEYMTVTPKLSRYANVMWAAQITAAARVKLHNYLLLQGTNAVYCDTDSVFSMEPVNGLGSTFGELVEPTSYKLGYIAAPKMYYLEDNDGTVTAKAKGVQRALALDYIKGNIVECNQPIRPRAGLARGLMPGIWMPTFKQRKYRLTKRHIIDPSYIDREHGYSDTLPITVSHSIESSEDDLD